MSRFSELAIAVQTTVIAVLHERADEACVIGDRALRDGLYGHAIGNYVTAAHYRIAARAIDHGRPVHPDDELTVIALRARVEKQLLDADLDAAVRYATDLLGASS